MHKYIPNLALMNILLIIMVLQLIMKLILNLISNLKRFKYQLLITKHLKYIFISITVLHYPENILF
jgi:hypothetical protein